MDLILLSTIELEDPTSRTFRLSDFAPECRHWIADRSRMLGEYDVGESLPPRSPW